jgi:ABC-2 type transport system permease protein
MRSIITIAWKDFKILVTSPTFFVISGLCCVIWSYVYVTALMRFAQSSMMGSMMGNHEQNNIQYSVFMNHISVINLVSIFFMPALTMRLLAEEKKLRTYDLLLTAPVTATQIAVGKFLAGFGAALILALISFIYPAATGLFASFAWLPLLTAYLGLLMVLALYVAIGLFASSLTESVVLSVIMGCLFTIALWFINPGNGSSDSAIWGAVMEHMSMGSQFMGFIRGSIKISAVVFMLSMVTMFVFLTQRVVESARWR